MWNIINFVIKYLTIKLNNSSDFHATIFFKLKLCLNTNPIHLAIKILKLALNTLTIYLFYLAKAYQILIFKVDKKYVI